MKAVVALGSNLGNCEENLNTAINHLPDQSLSVFDQVVKKTKQIESCAMNFHNVQLN